MGKCLRQQLLGFFTADLLPNNVEDGPRRENHQKLFFNFPIALRVYFTVVVLHCTLSQSLLLPFDDACMVCKKKAQWELLLQNSSFFRRHGDLRRDRSFSASFLVSNVHVNRVTHRYYRLFIHSQNSTCSNFIKFLCQSFTV